MEKIIKTSNRGLTFSFNGNGTKFNIGSKYKYILDKRSRKIYILSSGKMKVSRKRSGKHLKSLIDIRAKNIINEFKEQDVDCIKVEINKDVIIVTGLKEISSGKFKTYKEVEKVYLEKEVLEQLSFFDKLDGDKEIGKIKKIFSIFSGAGMLDKPFAEDKNFKIVKAIEYDKSACESYRENIGDVIEQGDVRKIKKEDIPDADILLGGTSCKVYSNANRHTRLEEHKDSDLLNHYLRIVKEGNFETFVLENVVELVTLENGKYLELIKKELVDYNINSYILKDSECGGYTTRKRVFLIGTKIKTPTINIAKKAFKTVRDALKKVNEKWFNYKDISKSRKGTIERMKYIPQGGNWQDIPKELWQKSYKVGKTHSNTLRRLALDKPSITLANFRKCILIHPTKNRIISVAEAISLSGFEKDFKVVGSLSERQMQIANGVPYNLGLTVKNIVKKLFAII